MAKEKDTRTDEKKEAEKPEKAPANAGLSMLLGVFLTLALVMGGFTVFLQDKDAPAGPKPEVVEVKREKCSKPLCVKVNEVRFTYNKNGKRRGRQAVASEIVFYLCFSEGYEKEALAIMRKQGFLGPGVGAMPDTYFPLQGNHRKGRMLRRVIKEHLMNTREEDWASPKSERLIGNSMGKCIQEFLQENLKPEDIEDKYLGIVEACDITVVPF